MKKYLYLFFALPLAACGGSGKLPQSCEEALKAYEQIYATRHNKLLDALLMADNTAAKSTIVQLYDEYDTQEHDGDVSMATEAWKKQLEAQYEATEKTSGSKTADLHLENLDKDCRNLTQQFQEYL